MEATVNDAGKYRTVSTCYLPLTPEDGTLGMYRGTRGKGRNEAGIVSYT